MRVKLQLVICHDDGQEETVTDVITLNKNNKRIEHLGLSLAESKQLLSTLQRHLLQQQVNTFLDTYSTCPDCRTPLKLKARGSRSFRTLFGTFTFSPFNIVIAGRAARTSTHDRRSRIRCLEAVLLCDRIEIGRGNVSTHVESPALT